MSVIAARAQQDQLKAKRVTSIAGLIIGAGYLIGMLLRLSLGYTFFADNYWFNSPLPTLFHMVLATFVLVASFSCLNNHQTK